MNFRISDTTMNHCLQKYYKVDAATCKQLRQSKGGLPEACRVLFDEKQRQQQQQQQQKQQEKEKENKNMNDFPSQASKPLSVEDLKTYFTRSELYVASSFCSLRKTGRGVASVFFSAFSLFGIVAPLQSRRIIQESLGFCSDL